MTDDKGAAPAGALDRAVEAYSARGWLRAAVAMVPYLGSAIDALITTRGAALTQRRIETLLEELRVAAEHLDDKKVNRDFLASEEFDDLMMRAFRSASETRDRDKIRLYAAILIGAASAELADVDPESILAAIAELSPLEITVARELYRQQHGQLSLDASGPDRDLELSEVNERAKDARWPARAVPNLSYHLKRIERTGLIAEITGTYWDYTGGAYRTTSTFRRLMRYLERRT